MSDYKIDFAVKKYNFDDLERKAYRLSLIWADKCKQVFPNYQHFRGKHGDPRKSLVFKFCYKLARETNTILSEDDYSNYVRAQLAVLKHITNGESYVDPCCLVGEKAWRRWKLWKNRYDKITSKTKTTEEVVTLDLARIFDGFQKTKEFIIKTYGVDPSIEKYKETYLNKNIFRWINFGKFSPYYIAMSPYISEIMSKEDFENLNFDVSYYKNLMSEEVISKFKEIFPYEFSIPTS